MPSLVTGIIGGIQGSSAAHNAANAQQQGYQNAANSVNTAVGNANPIISGAAGAAGAGVSSAAGAAGTQATTQAENAATGVNGAVQQGNSIINPYSTMGQGASQALSNLTAAGGFSFNPSDLQNTPGYQFQLQQGEQGITQNAAANGLLGSGGTLKALDQYNQGLASTTYNQQYQNALSAYNANLSTYLPQAQLGLTAGTTQLGNLTNAAQYTGNTNLQASEYAGTTGVQGAEYAGTAGMQGANQVASNLINAGVYSGNTQIGAGNAIAQGDIGAANQWNSMLGSIGSYGNLLGAALTSP